MRRETLKLMWGTSMIRFSLLRLYLLSKNDKNLDFTQIPDKKGLILTETSTFAFNGQFSTRLNANETQIGTKFDTITYA